VEIIPLFYKGNYYVDKTNCNWYAFWFRNHDVCDESI